MQLKIKPQDRVSVVGRTGSGKTTLLREILRYWIDATRSFTDYHIVILDNKKDGDFDGMGKKFTRLKQLSKLWDDNRVLIYEPHEEEQLGKEESPFLNGFFRWLRLTGEPLLLVIDELASVANGNKVSPEYELLMKQGRGKSQAIWAGVQNPVYVPHDFLSNANHFFVFDLLQESDRRKMASIVGDDVLTPPTTRGGDAAEYGFYYKAVNRRRAEFFPNNPPIKFPAVPFISEPPTNKDAPKGGRETMNWKWLLAIFLFAGLMVALIPLWKMGTRAVANKVPALEGVANYAAQA